MSLPVNFEDKVKLPPAPGGTGYPYRLSAADLMKNFVYASVVIDPFTREGIRNGIKQTISSGQGGHSNRHLFTEPFPEKPNEGDMMYFNGTEWVSLPSPSGSGLKVLTHNGTAPSWAETESC